MSSVRPNGRVTLGSDKWRRESQIHLSQADKTHPSSFEANVKRIWSVDARKRLGKDSIAFVLALCSALKEFASLSFVSNSGGVYFTMLASAVRNQLNKS